MCNNEIVDLIYFGKWYRIGDSEYLKIALAIIELAVLHTSCWLSLNIFYI
jgi:hypothetical protein